MKKIVYFIGIIAVCMYIASCNNNENIENDSGNLDSLNISDEKSDSDNIFIKSLFKNQKKFTVDLIQDKKIFTLLQGEMTSDNFEIEIMGEEEPCEIAYYFKGKMSETDMAKIDIEMRKVSYILLALVGDLEKVNWIYEDLVEQRYTFCITAVECCNDIGQDIKKFSESEAKLKELLDYCADK